MVIGIKEELSRVKKEARRQTLGYIAGGLGLVAGLAWNDAIKSAIELFIPASGNSIAAKFVYAAVITATVVVLLTYLPRFLKEEKDVLE